MIITIERRLWLAGTRGKADGCAVYQAIVEAHGKVEGLRVTTSWGVVIYDRPIANLSAELAQAIAAWDESGTIPDGAFQIEIDLPPAAEPQGILVDWPVAVFEAV